jgi:hypothetical protein
MIGQPNQDILASARLKLFETFCYPTLRKQTNQNYFWFVLVDDRLDPHVFEKMKLLLSNFVTQNAYMVLTNNTDWAADGVGVPGVSSYGVGLYEIAKLYSHGSVNIVTGNTTYLREVLNIMEGRRRENKQLLIIETLLDADDGLNNHGIDWIQGIAMNYTTQQQKQIQQQTTSPVQPSLNTTWWVMCGTDHIEWHNRDIYQLTQTEYEERGLTSGLAGTRHKPLYCASAGYTRVGLTTAVTTTTNDNQNISDDNPIVFPQKAYSNHALATEFPTCNVTYPSECLHRVLQGKAYILKSRSITSDSKYQHCVVLGI